jgi:hypothetical protein
MTKLFHLTIQNGFNLWLGFLSVSLFVCHPTIGQKTEPPFSTATTPPPPDYANPAHWAALPNRTDNADKVPKNSNGPEDRQAGAPADVFFVHPTIFTYKPANAYYWNGDVNDTDLNRRVDESTILNQATAFNAAGRVFAPRYRQAHLRSYYTTDTVSARQAFELAYGDVRAAFEHYLKNHNQGRPVIIAAHSQGTQHAKRLLRELFDGTPLQRQLVAAYLVGMPTPPDYFRHIPPAVSPGQTGGFVTWCTYARDYYPSGYEREQRHSLAVNPITWDTTAVRADRRLNKGVLGKKFKILGEGVIDAQVHRGMVWVGKPKIFGAALVKTKNWHFADYNLFWVNVRENAALRVARFVNSGTSSR